VVAWHRSMRQATGDRPAEWCSKRVVTMVVGTKSSGRYDESALLSKYDGDWQTHVNDMEMARPHVPTVQSLTSHGQLCSPA
jgi:hypothetical protein